MKFEYLTLDDLLALAGDLGVSRVRDLGLLDAAAHRPKVSLMGQDAYAELHDKAAVLLESLVRNDPLVDGNKRLGWMSVFVFYGLNGYDLDAPEDDAYDLDAPEDDAYDLDAPEDDAYDLDAPEDDAYDLDAPEDDAYDLVIGSATGTLTYQSVAERLAEWVRAEVAQPPVTGS